MKASPSVERLRELLAYDPDTGLFTWRVQRGGSAVEGADALTTRLPRGYRYGNIDGVRNLYAHRVAWKMHHGREPDGEIDHINGDTSDNRIANLRECTRGENQKNMRLSRRNKTGASGIQQKQSGRWCAMIGAPPARLYLGIYDTKEEAMAARRGAERALNYHPNHGRQKS